MIRAIFFFNVKEELLIKRLYSECIDFRVVYDLVLENLDINFAKIDNETVVYKQFDELIVAFVVKNEDEMYVLSFLNLLMSAMDKLLGNLDQSCFVYHFKDVIYALDNCVIGGKIINLNSLDISTSPYYFKPYSSDE